MLTLTAAVGRVAELSRPYVREQMHRLLRKANKWAKGLTAGCTRTLNPTTLKGALQLLIRVDPNGLSRCLDLVVVVGSVCRCARDCRGAKGRVGLRRSDFRGQKRLYYLVVL